MNKRGLGRGLEALIPETSAFAPQVGEMILSLEIDAIEPNPLQPRKDFAEEELGALADSIRDQGILQPILVRQPTAGRYQLIAGERRWRAAKLADYERIPAIVRDTQDDQLLPLALVENLVREDLNPIEEAHAYRDLAEEAEWSHGEIAERIGKSRSHVANAIRLLKLPKEIQGDVATGRLSSGHARSILTCATEQEMFALRDTIITDEMTVREVEEHIADVSSQPPKPRKKRRAERNVSPETRELEERLTRVFGTPVQVRERRGRGRVLLEFYSYDDLQRLTDLMLLAGNRGGFGG